MKRLLCGPIADPQSAKVTTGRISPPQTACGLEFESPLLRPIGWRPCPRLKTASRALYFKVDGVGHQAIQWAIFDYQRSKNFIRNTHLRPTYKPVIQGFMSPMDRWSIPPPQTVPDHVDDAAGNLALIDTRHSVCQKDLYLNLRFFIFTLVHTDLVSALVTLWMHDQL